MVLSSYHRDKVLTIKFSRNIRYFFADLLILKSQYHNIWAPTRENLCGGISASVIRFLKSIICKLATGEISIFYLVSVAEETGLKLVLSETPKTGLSRRGPYSRG